MNMNKLMECKANNKTDNRCACFRTMGRCSDCVRNCKRCRLCARNAVKR